MEVDLTKKHEWDLALLMRQGVETENFELCAAIHEEVERRRAQGTLNQQLVNAVLKSHHPAAKLAFEPQV